MAPKKDKAPLHPPFRYHIAWSSSMQEVEDEVTEMLNVGWKTVGGVTIQCDGSGCTFGQAMVIDREEIRSAGDLEREDLHGH